MRYTPASDFPASRSSAGSWPGSVFKQAPAYPGLRPVSVSPVLRRPGTVPFRSQDPPMQLSSLNEPRRRRNVRAWQASSTSVASVSSACCFDNCRGNGQHPHAEVAHRIGAQAAKQCRLPPIAQLIADSGGHCREAAQTDSVRTDRPAIRKQFASIAIERFADQSRCASRAEAAGTIIVDRNTPHRGKQSGGHNQRSSPGNQQAIPFVWCA